jgi:cholesterol oxidase
MRRLFLPLSRRTFVKLGAASAAAYAIPLSGCGRPARVEEVENLIIGSGFGGSIAAYRLAERGVSSTILERGRRWTVTTPGEDVFSNMGISGDDRFDNRSAWLAERQPLPGIPMSGAPMRPYTGVLEKIYGDGMNIVCASCVGGGSVVYSGMMVQPPQNLFEEVFPDGIEYAAMNDQWYPLVRSMMTPAASTLPDDILAMPQWAATRTFLEQATKAGYDAQRMLCAFDWEAARAEARGDLPPQLIRGHYIFGLNSGAKGTLDRSYLGLAEDTGLVDVRPLHWVQRIAREGERYRVEVDRIDEQGVVLEQIVYLSDTLFVCAGSANTTGLLLRAKAEGGLPDLPESLGTGWGNNGQHILARRNVGVDTGAFQAGPACAMILDHENRIAMENGPAPLGLEQQILISTGQGIPTSRGRITWDAAEQKVGVSWQASFDQESADASLAILDRLNMANAGERYTIPGLDEPITFHPLGGCVMGETADLFGRVNGYPGLYVLDGALIPGCTPCSNPFWTIAANAERCIATLRDTDFA